MSGFVGISVYRMGPTHYNQGVRLDDVLDDVRDDVAMRRCWRMMLFRMSDLARSDAACVVLMLA